MVNLLPKLKEIGRKLIKLERVIVRLKKENEQLEDRVKELENQLQGEQKDHKITVGKYEAIKLAKSLPSTLDATAIEEKIDLYLKEIDICLKNFGD